MQPENAIDQVKRELQGAIEKMHSELDRVEILSAALNAFCQPVPEYEPRFCHMAHLTANAQELGSRRN